jgi:hypothetical protein
MDMSKTKTRLEKEVDGMIDENKKKEEEKNLIEMEK